MSDRQLRGPPSNVDHIGGTSLAAEAVDKCLRSTARLAGPGVSTSSGRLRHPTSGLSRLSGLRRTALSKKRSFMSGHLGESRRRVYRSGTTAFLRAVPIPFDFEAFETRLVDRNDVAAGIVYDTYCSGKEDKPSRATPCPPARPPRPAADDLFLNASDAARRHAGLCGTGHLGCHFWYTRPVHPLKLSLPA
jgi:hypothetical protein